MKNGTLLLGLLFLLVLQGCQSPPAKDRQSAGLSIIFDTDIGDDVDDVLALDMLYKYLEDGKINLLGIVSSKDDHPYTEEFIDIMNTWYGHPDIPIGIMRNRLTNEDFIYEHCTKYTKVVCEMKTSDGKPLFPRTLNGYDSLPLSEQLMRKLLVNEPDSSVVIITVGYFTNIARLLESAPDQLSPLNGKELVEKKVKYLCLMGGHFETVNKITEFNAYLDTVSSKLVFEKWPTRIIASGIEIGNTIYYPAESILNDFGYTQFHPMVEAYKCYFPMPYDRPTWDLTSVLYVVEQDSSFFDLSAPGDIQIKGDGKTYFTDRVGGNHYFLKIDSIQRERVSRRFLDIITQIPEKYKN